MTVNPTSVDVVTASPPDGHGGDGRKPYHCRCRNSVTGPTGAAVTAVTPTFGNALTSVQTTATPGSFLTGATLATTSGNAVTNVSATTTPVAVINNATIVNGLATNPARDLFPTRRIERRDGQQSARHSKRAELSPAPRRRKMSSPLSTPTTAPFLTGATLNTTAGNALTGVTTTSTNAPFVNGVTGPDRKFCDVRNDYN